MAGPRFRDDEPVFNPFDKPVICIGESDPPTDCCSLCEAWTQCLQRVPWRVDLSGFYLHDLFNHIRFNGLACNIGENGAIEFTGEGVTSDDPQFVGAFVMEPKRWDLTDFGVPDRAGDPLTCLLDHHATCGSHFGRSYRTISTPAGQLTPITRAYIDFNASCRLNDEDEPVVVLEVWLVTWFEQLFGCVNPCPNQRAIACHKILESAEVPITLSTTWSDFLNVPLLPIDQGDDETPLNRFAVGCMLPSDEECEWSEAPAVGYREDGPAPNFGNTASVLAQSCDFVLNCSHCDREEPPDRTKPLTPATIDFTASTGGGCYKSFTAIAPECLGEMQWFWSFGQTGELVSHLIANTGYSGITDYAEEITLVGIDPRGCIYYVTKEVTCGCCPGASGDLIATPDGDGCSVELCASITNGSGACEGLDALIEVQYGATVSEPYPGDDACLCTDLDPDDPNYEACYSRMVMLKNGQCLTLTGLWRGYRWRLWDRLCGCPGPWTDVENPICETLSLSGSPLIATEQTGDFEIQPECDRWVATVTLTMQFPAYACGERIGLRVKFGSWYDDCHEGSITNPGDDPEEQIAEVIVVIPGVVFGPSPHICWEMWFIVGGCPDEGDPEDYLICQAWFSLQANCDNYGNNGLLNNPLTAPEWCDAYGA